MSSYLDPYAGEILAALARGERPISIAERLYDKEGVNNATLGSTRQQQVWLISAAIRRMVERIENRALDEKVSRLKAKSAAFRTDGAVWQVWTPEKQDDEFRAEELGRANPARQ